VFRRNSIAAFVVIIVAACGAEVVETSEPGAGSLATPTIETTTTSPVITSTTKPIAASTTQTTTPLPEDTTSTTVAAATGAAFAMTEAITSALELQPRVPIAEPTGIPTLEEMAERIGPLGAPHPFAGITVWFMFVDDAAIAAGEFVPEDRPITITYYGDLKILDVEDYRQVDIGSRRFTLEEDGTWFEDDFWEGSPIDAFFEWHVADVEAILERDFVVVGFEMVAGTPTVHIRLSESDAVSEFWIDEIGTPFRVIAVGGEYVWVLNVETTTPEVTGPLPSEA
jgi:hypothetical protein